MCFFTEKVKNELKNAKEDVSSFLQIISEMLFYILSVFRL